MRTRSDDLEILLTVVDCGGFSAASNMLGIQVARVSRAVNKIEAQLGVSLLNRTTRKMDLTQEGQTFVETIRHSLGQIEQAEEAVINQGKLPQGRLVVDAASPFMLHQIIPLVAEFKKEYPDISLHIRSNEGIVDLLEKRTDVAIRIGKLTDSSLHARALGTSALYIVAAPAYLARYGVPKKVQDLTAHQFIAFDGPKSLNQWPLSGFVMPEACLVASNGEAVRQLALTGNGIACLSGFMVKQDIEKGDLIPILVDDLLPSAEREQVNAVYYKSSQVARRISAFLDFIQPRLEL